MKLYKLGWKNRQHTEFGWAKRQNTSSQNSEMNTLLKSMPGKLFMAEGKSKIQ